MTDRDRLIELLRKSGASFENALPEEIADYLLANGVVVLDTKIVTPQNRPLITQIAGMPINDVLDLLRAKKEGRLIVPPFKNGQIIYFIEDFEGRLTIGGGIIYSVKKYGLNGECNWEAIAYVGSESCRIIPEYLGKTVFLTKEEAEEKLKERELK